MLRRVLSVNHFVHSDIGQGFCIQQSAIEVVDDAVNSGKVAHDCGAGVSGMQERGGKQCSGKQKGSTAIFDGI